MSELSDESIIEPHSQAIALPHGRIDEGPIGYRIWKSSMAGFKSTYAEEIPLYSDVNFTNEIRAGIGPYFVLNGLSQPIESGKATAALYLRIDFPNDPRSSHGPVNVTDDRHYHGGGCIEEFSALLSLLHCARLKPGSPTRHFYSDSDPRGMPFNLFSKIPQLSPIMSLPILPRALGSREIQPGLLARYIELDPTTATALVRAARFFQDAIWIGESEPSLAWLMLVSAMESAAVHWREEEQSPEVLFRSIKPAWAEELARHGGDDLVRSMAKQWTPLLKSTDRFIKFGLEFALDPPAQRPHEAFRFRWDRAMLKQALGHIYDYRSQALHTGKPFPPILCQPPHTSGDGTAPAEIPNGLGMSGGGGTWVKENFHINLDTFVYIAQQALINWWRSLLS